MLELKKIDVMSLAKISTILGVVFGFILGILETIAYILAPSTPTYAALGFLAVIIFPIVYAIIGFVGGVITAFIYNIVAERIGGITVDLQTVSGTRKQKIKELYKRS